MRIHFVWGFCMGAQGAEQPKTAVSGPGSWSMRMASWILQLGVHENAEFIFVLGTGRALFRGRWLRKQRRPASFRTAYLQTFTLHLSTVLHMICQAA